nr:ORF126 [Acipenserid herpesvirus 1]
MAKNTTANHISGSRLGLDGKSLNLVNLSTIQVMINQNDWVFFDLFPQGGSFFCKFCISTLTKKVTMLFDLSTTKELKTRMYEFAECLKNNKTEKKLLKIDTIVTETASIKMEMKKRGHGYVIAIKFDKKELVFDASLAAFMGESFGRIIAAKDKYEHREELNLPDGIEMTDRDGFKYKLEVGHNSNGPYMRITKLDIEDINNYILIPFNLFANVRKVFEEAQTARQPFEKIIGDKLAVYKLEVKVTRYSMKIFHNSTRHKRQLIFHQSLWMAFVNAFRDCEENEGLQKIFKLTRPKFDKMVVNDFKKNRPQGA